MSTENAPLPSEVRKDALGLQKLVEYDDEGAEGECPSDFDGGHVLPLSCSDPRLFCSSGVSSHMDDEYKWAGVEDPKVMVTTSRDPSSRLKMFAKV